MPHRAEEHPTVREPGPAAIRRGLDTLSQTQIYSTAGHGGGRGATEAGAAAAAAATDTAFCDVWDRGGRRRMSSKGRRLQLKRSYVRADDAIFRPGFASGPRRHAAESWDAEPNSLFRHSSSLLRVESNIERPIQRPGPNNMFRWLRGGELTKRQSTSTRPITTPADKF